MVRAAIIGFGGIAVAHRSAYANLEKNPATSAARTIRLIEYMRKSAECGGQLIKLE